MPRLGPVHWKTLECIFLKFGFKYNRQKGDHKLYTKPECLRPVCIPTYDEIDIDIIKSNMRTAKMSRNEYFRLLAEC